MHLPEALLSLTDHGIIDEVIRPLKSGKEAQVYLVYSGGETRVAKVYKDADQRSFKQRAQYMEGRRVRNTRDRRAMERRSRHGKAQEEAAWKSAEVDIIYRLHAQGVRVPTPHNFIDGVLIMELVRGADGEPAPRLSELALDPRTAQNIYEQLLREVIKMLCAGIVHGDLSDYNVLIDEHGPVIIDFPQSVDASQNRNARRLLVRDVDNLGLFLNRCVPGARRRPYGQEIWSAYESNTLTPELELRGSFRRSSKPTNMGALLDEIDFAEKNEARRREAAGEQSPKPRRRQVMITPAQEPESERGKRRGRGSRGGSKRGGRNGQGRGGQSRQNQSRQGQSRQDQPRQNQSRQGEGQPRQSESQRQGPRAATGSSDHDRPRGEGAPRRRRRRRRGGGGQAENGNQGGGNQGGGNQGSRNQGSRNQGSRNQGSRNQGSRNQGSRNQGSRSQDSRSQDSRSQGSRNQDSRGGGQERGGRQQGGDPTRGRGNDNRGERSRSGQERQRSLAQPGPAAANRAEPSAEDGQPRRRRRRRRRRAPDSSGDAGESPRTD